jgi:cytochrome c oxidase cbb3-type subunit 2
VHINIPRDVVPESNMPSFPWLEQTVLDGALTPKKLETMRTLGVPYSDEDIAGATAAVKGKTELDALIAYLQNLGTAISARR